MALDQYKYRVIEDADIKLERSLKEKLENTESRIVQTKRDLMTLLEEQIETFCDFERNSIEYDESERKKLEEETRELKEKWKIGTKEQFR